jgi:hypothetical protein
MCNLLTSPLMKKEMHSDEFKIDVDQDAAAFSVSHS